MSVALLFPGQGSQSIGMLAELAASWPQVEQTFAEASAVLGYDLWQLVQEGPLETLNQTDKTQPAMLAAGVTVARVWQAAAGAQPSHMAGHSLGEYSALVCSGVLAFGDAIKLVERRGQLMQSAVPEGEGAMAAILGLSDEEVTAACEAAADTGVVQAVNFNSPGQVVIAGAKAAVERTTEIAKERGAKRALMLPVSVPSHCELMKPAAEQLTRALDEVELSAPKTTVIHNADVQPHSDAASIKQALVAQLYSPVRWVETVLALKEAGVTTVIECGPGKVLAGLNKRIDRGMSALPLFDTASLAKALDAVE